MDKEQKRMHEKLFGKDAVKKAEEKNEVDEGENNTKSEEEVSELDRLLDDAY